MLGRILTLGLALAVSASSTVAEVRRCYGPVSGGPQLADGTLAGRKAAVVAWLRAAAKVGATDADWAHAGTRSLICRSSPTGSGIVCEAHGVPCVARPVDMNPLPLPGPKAKVIKVPQ